MHILTINSSIELADDYTVTPGEYAVEDVAGGQFLCLANGGTMRPLEEKRVPMFSASDADRELMIHRESNPDRFIEEPCSSILISRLGGLGDLVLLTPVLREIKRRWPSVKLAVTGIKEFLQPLMHLPYVDELLPSPVSMEVMRNYDGWIFLENVIERSPGNDKLNSVDLVANHIGLDMSQADKRQDYRVTMRENIWAEEAFPRINGTRRLCVQVGASARIRTYPQPLLGQVVATMLKNKWEVFLMGGGGTIKMEPRPGLHLMADGYTFRQRCAVIAGADCVLAPDSSLTHIAGALEIPCVALYSVFHSNQRTKYAPTTFAINAPAACAPCQHHEYLNHPFPKDGPCAVKGFCVPLSEIKPERIVALIETRAKGFKLHLVEDLPAATTPVSDAPAT